MHVSSDCTSREHAAIHTILYFKKYMLKNGSNHNFLHKIFLTTNINITAKAGVAMYNFAEKH